MPLQNQPRRDTRLNPPEEILARACLLLGLAGVAAGPLLFIAGVANGDAASGGAGLLSVAVGGGLLRRLHRQGRLAELAHSLAHFGFGSARMDPLQTEQARIEDELETMETRRGTADFDPWQLLHLRRKLDSLRRKNSSS